MKKSTIHLFVFDTMSDWEYGHRIAGINNPQCLKTPGRFKVKTVALSDRPFTPPGHNSCRPNRAKNLGAAMKESSGTIRTIIQG